MRRETINVLLCIDDFKGDYSRHCAVTILSLLDSNKDNKIKIFIMSTYIPKDNIDELKKIVDSYDQDIEFIIKDDIIPREIKNNLINRRNLTYATFYRLFFSLYIKNIDRILYMDCDVLVTKDISEIYNMDMHGKTIAGNLDASMTRDTLGEYFFTSNYINAGVILIDVQRFSKSPIKLDDIKRINEKFGEYIGNVDQDYLNIIFRNEIFVYGKAMNFLVFNPFLLGETKNVCIYHCIAKPYTINNNYCPSKLVKLYFYYLGKTKWKDLYPYPKNNIFTYMLKVIRLIVSYLYLGIFYVVKSLFGNKGIIKFSELTNGIVVHIIRLLNKKG